MTFLLGTSGVYWPRSLKTAAKASAKYNANSLSNGNPRAKCHTEPVQANTFPMEMEILIISFGQDFPCQRESYQCF
jgi:hypothetical protein